MFRTLNDRTYKYILQGKSQPFTESRQRRNKRRYEIRRRDNRNQFASSSDFTEFFPTVPPSLIPWNVSKQTENRLMNTIVRPCNYPVNYLSFRDERNTVVHVAGG